MAIDVHAHYIPQSLIAAALEVITAQPETRRCPPQNDGELMTEKQILGFKPAPRLEQVGDEHSERVQDCKHRYQ